MSKEISDVDRQKRNSTITSYDTEKQGDDKEDRLIPGNTETEQVKNSETPKNSKKKIVIISIILLIAIVVGVVVYFVTKKDDTGGDDVHPIDPDHDYYHIQITASKIAASSSGDYLVAQCANNSAVIYDNDFWWVHTVDEVPSTSPIAVSKDYFAYQDASNVNHVVKLDGSEVSKIFDDLPWENEATKTFQISNNQEYLYISNEVNFTLFNIDSKSMFQWCQTTYNVGESQFNSDDSKIAVSDQGYVYFVQTDEFIYDWIPLVSSSDDLGTVCSNLAMSDDFLVTCKTTSSLNVFAQTDLTTVVTTIDIGSTIKGIEFSKDGKYLSVLDEYGLKLYTSSNWSPYTKATFCDSGYTLNDVTFFENDMLLSCQEDGEIDQILKIELE